MGKKQKHASRLASGEPFQYDSQFNGPIKNRSCTDILCLLLFVAFIIAWVVLAGYAYKTGNPERLILPTDSAGNICGQGDFQDRPYLFFFDLLQCTQVAKSLSRGCPTPQVCVSSCPSETFAVQVDLKTGKKSEKELKEKLICKYDVNKDEKSVSDLVGKGYCASYYLESKAFSLSGSWTNEGYVPLTVKENMGGRCLPNFLKDGADEISKVVVETGEQNKVNGSDFMKRVKIINKLIKAREYGEMVFKDLKASWKLILIGLIVAMVLSFLWILLMRWVAGLMVLLSILIVLALSAFGCYYAADRYVKMKNNPAAQEDYRLLDPDSYLQNQKTWLVFAIISGVIFLVLLLILLFLRKRIRISIALIREGSKAVGCMMSSLFFPLLVYILQLVVLVLWGSVAMFIASNGEPQWKVFNASSLPVDSKYKEGDPCKPQTFREEGLPEEHCILAKFGDDDRLIYAQIYNLFGLFWGMFFVVGLGQVSLAGAFASYYWAFNKPHDVPAFAVAGGFFRCIRYHTGSVAFGSLLLATVRIIRVFLEFVDKQLKKYKENFIAKCLLMCCKCCFWCLEKFIKFINKNAYIMIAVYGKNFCTSAKNAFKLLMRNVVRVVVIDKVTDFLLFIGKLVVVGAIGVASFFFFNRDIPVGQRFVPDLNYIWLPITVIVFGSYVIANSFFSVYNMAVDTLFLCFLEDCERNDGTPSKPYYMSKELMKILDKKNKFVEVD